MLTYESVCSELTIAKKKWLCLGIYRLPTPENLVSFFQGLTVFKSLVSQKQD